MDSVVVKVKNSNSDVVKQTTLSSSLWRFKRSLDSLSKWNLYNRSNSNR